MVESLFAIKKVEDQIGREIRQAFISSIRTQTFLSACPICKTGKLTIINSYRTGKRFIGCTNYRNGCRASAPILQRSLIKNNMTVDFLSKRIGKNGTAQNRNILDVHSKTSGNLKFSAEKPSPVSLSKTCLFCTNEPESEFDLCRHHAKVEENLGIAYKNWRLAYGWMAWKNCLAYIIKSRNRCAGEGCCSV